MEPLTDRHILEIWEAGEGLGPARRALLILQAADPDRTFDRSVDLPLNERDLLLYSLRESTWGHQLECRTSCPRCSEQLEFTLSTSEICDSFIEGRGGQPDMTVASGGWRLQFRLPTSRDLLEIQTEEDAGRAERSLLERCLLSASHEGQAASASGVPDGVLALISEKMSACCPGADVSVALSCPHCDNSWNSGFDVAGYLWSEIAAAAERLLWEVHVLASTYGWTETEILSVPRERRRKYLEMICG